MEEQILGATKLVNWILGKPEGALFALLGIRPANPEYRIPNHIAMEIVDFGSLDALMAQFKKIPEESALDVGVQIARGLKAGLDRTKRAK